MKPRILRLSTLPSSYQTDFYRRHPHVAQLPPIDQLRAIFDDHFAQGDSYTRELVERGYPCEEIVVNVQPALATTSHRDSSSTEIATLQCASNAIQTYRPEILWINNYSAFDSGWLQGECRRAGTVRLIYCWCGVKPTTPGCIPACDRILTSNNNLASFFTHQGKDVSVIPFAFDERVLSRIPPVGCPADKKGISFIGTVRRHDGFHQSRARVIEELSEVVPLDVYTEDASVPRWRRLGRAVLAQARSRDVTRSPEVPPRCWRELVRQVKTAACREHDVWSRTLAPVFGLEMFGRMAESLVTLNVHADCAGDQTGNIRLFEATGVAACLLTDRKKDLGEYFDLDTEVVTFGSVEECVEKAVWLAEHRASANEIAQAGQRRTLQAHTYRSRVDLLEEVIKADL